MTTWTERAKAYLATTPPEQTPKTPGSTVSGVLGVASGEIDGKTHDGFGCFGGALPGDSQKRDRLPDEVRERVRWLLRAGRIDDDDAALIADRYHAHDPREWDQLFDWLEASQ